MGKVFAWNRLGLKGSDEPRSAQTGTAVVAGLRELLRYAGLEPPYVIVAHSLGGLFANLFARLHPEEVSAMMLLEATHPQDHEVLKKHETFLAQGVARVLSLPQKLLGSNLHSEIDCIGESVREIAHAGPFPEIPLCVVTGGRAPPSWMMSPAAVGARRAHQQDLARMSPWGEQVIAQASGHFPQLTEPELVLRELDVLMRS
jgi:pimeloyl-ACP methyl ester carboxylesterase